MKTNFLILLLATGIVSCSEKKAEPGKETDSTEVNKENVKQKNKAPETDTMPRVVGIGGIFFKAKEGKTLKEWYGKNLGLSIDEYGTLFESRNVDRPDEKEQLQWSIFSDKTKYFDPSKKEFMINYRVVNLEGLVRKFKKEGVTVCDTIQSYDYGKFVHILDPEGNKIELWEPVSNAFSDDEYKKTK